MLLAPHIKVLAFLAVTTQITATVIPFRRTNSHGHFPKPAAFYLAGDSTTAAQSDEGGGWGVGFLKTLQNKAIGTDLGYNGATTVSFVYGGVWANVIDAVNRSKESFNPYVTIQFGHNDQKVSANISIGEYSTNLQNLALEAQAAGATPILVTPISRRNFNSSGLVIEDLADQRVATIAVAQSIGVDYIDLNEASTNYLDAIGSVDASTYNRVPNDFTHLNPSGSVVFGDMVSLLLRTTTKVGKVLSEYTCPNPKVETAIEKGVYIFPSS